MLIIMTLFLVLHRALAYTKTPHSQVATNTSKAGLAWNNGVDVDITQFTTTGKVSWCYTWYPTGFQTSLEFVPQLWGPGQIDIFSASIHQTLATGNVTAVLGMNEPQEAGQSNLTPQQGAEMWKTYLEPLRSHGVRLGSPATSSSPSGLKWLQDFFAACAGGCTVDFIAIHWYDVNATAFQLYLQNFYGIFQRPIWVTEWACQNYNDVNAQCTQEDVVVFLNQTQHFMDNTPWVERYAWFGAMKNLNGVNQANALMDESGKINDLGRQYIGEGHVLVTGSGSPALTGNGIWVCQVGLSLYVTWLLVVFLCQGEIPTEDLLCG